MNKSSEKPTVRVIGIDLGKHNFQLWGVNKKGQVQLDKQISRSQLKIQLAKMQPCLVIMEACSSSLYWARLLRSYGHDVRLIPPQFVKPYIKSNKNDRADAEAICEAVQRPRMRFVAIKEVDQQDIQSLHRIRSMAVANRTAQINQIRGLLMEYGIELPQGRRRVRGEFPRILEDAENGLTTRFRESAPWALRLYWQQFGNINAFRNGREMAAWVGLVPRQHSTGGKDRLLGISKRGDVYLRTILIHGARAALRTIGEKQDKRSRWARNLLERRDKNVAAVAMANKTVRTAYALLKHGGVYQAGATTLAG